jgi:uncharacterized protein (TIGR03083 family)
MSVSYLELVSAVRREGEALVSAAGQGGDEPVPTCDGWTVDRLLVHIGRVWTSSAHVVGERLTSAAPRPDVPEGKTPVQFAADALDELVEALRSCDPDTPMWNWADEAQTAMFWARRMAHESAVHRYDAQRSRGLAQPIAADLAHDGLDELVDVIVPRIVARDQPTLPEATYSFVATDEGTWNVRLGPDGVTRLDALKSPDVTVRGTTSALLLAAYSRVDWSSLDVDGDAALLDAWSKALNF